MRRRRLTPEELRRRAAEIDRENIREVARGFKDIVEKDKSRVPSSFQLKTRQDMWKFAAVREKMRAEMEDIADSVREGIVPPDINERVARLALAEYFLEKMDEMLKATLEHGGAAMTAFFAAAHEKVRTYLLDDSYFSKSPLQLIDSYGIAEPAFVACAECTSVPLLGLRGAVDKYWSGTVAKIQKIFDAKDGQLGENGAA